MNESRRLLCDVVAGRRTVDFLIETGRIAAVPNRSEALAAGHCVFFPKQHAASLHEVSDAALAELLPAIKRAAAAMGVDSYNGYNVLQNNGALAGQTVFHAHLHLIPKPSAESGLRRMGDAPRIDHGDVFEQVRAAVSHSDAYR